MFVWLQNNIGTIVISGILIAMVVGATVSLIRRKKKGQSPCGCGCGCGNCCAGCGGHTKDNA